MTWHAIDRALERLGLALTPGEVAELRRAVRRGAALLQADRGTAVVYLVRHAASGRLLSVVCPRGGDRVLTVLPPGRLSPPASTPKVHGRRSAPRREAQRLRREIQEVTA